MEIFPQLTFIKTAGSLLRLGNELINDLVVHLGHYYGFTLILCGRHLTPRHHGYFSITYFYQLDNSIA